MSPKAKFMIDSFIYAGISRKLDSAIYAKDLSEIELLSELVDYYNKEIITSGKYLTDKLDELKQL